MAAKNNGGPALPVDAEEAHRIGVAASVDIEDAETKERIYVEAYARAIAGMSLRDYFAAHAPPPPDEWIAEQRTREGKNRTPYAELRAEWSFAYADAMLSQREQ